jgi:S-adenosylmethionine:tRNA ribosyltransferase-isomerase
MRISDYDYELPEALIAQEPAAERAASRMLVVDRAAKSFRDNEFASFVSCLRDDDVLVLNNTKVFPARLLGVTETGANVEIFLVTRKTEKVWEALGRPTRRMRGERKLLSATISPVG